MVLPVRVWKEEGKERRFRNGNWGEKGMEMILERVEEYSTLCVCVCLKVRGGILLNLFFRMVLDFNQVLCKCFIFVCSFRLLKTDCLT